MSKKMARSGHTRCAMHIGKRATKQMGDRIRAEALLMVKSPKPLFRLAVILP